MKGNYIQIFSAVLLAVATFYMNQTADTIKEVKDEVKEIRRDLHDHETKLERHNTK